MSESIEDNASVIKTVRSKLVRIWMIFIAILRRLWSKLKDNNCSHSYQSYVQSRNRIWIVVVQQVEAN